MFGYIKLNRKVKRHVKFMIMMFAGELLTSCNYIYAKIKRNVLDDSIITDMDHMAGHVILRFIKKCNGMLAISSMRVEYIKKTIKKHIIPIIQHVFEFYNTKLNKYDTVSLLLDCTGYDEHVPHFYRDNHIKRSDTIMSGIRKKLNAIVYK